MNYQHAQSKTPKPFSTVDLVRKTSNVLHAATLGPQIITKSGKPRFVLMSKELFDQINPRKAYRTDDTPDEVLEWLLPALKRTANGEGYDD